MIACEHLSGFSFPFENIAKELYRVLKPGRVLVWVVADATVDGSETGTSFKQALYFKDIGFNLHDTMIYQRTNVPFPEKTRYVQCFDYMFILSKGIVEVFNPVLKINKAAGHTGYRTYRQIDGSLLRENENKPIKTLGVENNVWVIHNNFRSSTKDLFSHEHPAIFPEELVRRHIQSWTNEGDLIYDPFMGSGTTAKVAIQMDRNFIGSEISKEYYEIIIKRISKIKKSIKNSLTEYFV